MGKCFNTFKGVTVRVLFAIHIGLCVYRLVEVKSGKDDIQWEWWLIAAVAGILLFVEAGITLGYSKHGEWRRFVPCIFIYLLGTVPALALTEWTALQARLEYQETTKTCPSFSVNMTADSLNFGDAQLTYNWSLALQQALVILLVAGRWILPKGKMSREKLSNMLLAYVGMAADILEFYSEGFQTEAIRCQETVLLAILCLWAVSLMQFAIELTHTIKKRTKSISQINETVVQRCQNSEVWAIIIIVLFQDGPFLAMRLFLIIKFQILEQGLLFFTFKNVLVVLLQLYRLWILLCLTWDSVEGKFSFRLVASVRDNNNRPDFTHSVSMGEDNDAFESEDRRQSYPGGKTSRPQSYPGGKTTSRPQSRQPYNGSPRSPQEDTQFPYNNSPRSPQEAAQFNFNEPSQSPYGRGNQARATETHFGQQRPQSPLHEHPQPGYRNPPFDQGYPSQQVPHSTRNGRGNRNPPFDQGYPSQQVPHSTRNGRGNHFGRR